jgi:hypothetical protein
MRPVKAKAWLWPAQIRVALAASSGEALWLQNHNDVVHIFRAIGYCKQIEFRSSDKNFYASSVQTPIQHDTARYTTSSVLPTHQTLAIVCTGWQAVIVHGPKKAPCGCVNSDQVDLYAL